MLPLLYRTEERYGWSVGMRAVTHALLAGVHVADGPVVDFGCGGGRMLSELDAARSRAGTLCGVDLHPHRRWPTRQNRRGAEGALRPEPPARTAVYAITPSRCVLRSTPMTSAASTGASAGGELPYSAVRTECSCCVSAPTPGCGSPRHRFQHRTSLREAMTCMQALQRAGLAPKRVTYANTLLSGPAGAVRLLQRWRLLPFLPSLYTTQELNALLAAALA